MQNPDNVNARRLLSLFWLQHEEISYEGNSCDGRLRQFAAYMNINLSDVVFQKASLQLNGKLIDGDIEGWVVFVCFRSHPHFLWNFMLDTVALAKNDGHLDKIANSLAEHILAHYGSMVPDFEEVASTDQKFKRMLTGVWRHRMSDDVWNRLRIMQSEVSDPLASMIPLENGTEYMSGSLTQSDRVNADKGPYFKDEGGDWQRVQKPKHLPRC